MANRPEIKIYPVETTYFSPTGESTRGPWAGMPHGWNRQEILRGARSAPSYLERLVGKPVTVHTSGATEGSGHHPGTARAGIFSGILEEVLADSILIRSAHGQVLIFYGSIVAIESQ